MSAHASLGIFPPHRDKWKLRDQGWLLWKLPYPDYEDTSGNAQAYDPPLSFYNSRQDADLCDMVLAGHLYAGADYGLNAKTLLGLKLTYSMLGDIEASGGYSLHPFHELDPDFPNHNTFTGPSYWTLALTGKFLFGN